MVLTPKTVTRQGLPGMCANAVAWGQVLAGEETGAPRPSPGRWSNLEYACHVRDVFRKFDERLQLMLSEEDPTFPNGTRMDRRN